MLPWSWAPWSEDPPVEDDSNSFPTRHSAPALAALHNLLRHLQKLSVSRGFTTVPAVRGIRKTAVFVRINVACVGKKTHGSLRIQFCLEYHADTSTITGEGVRWSRNPSMGLGEHCFC